jgi:hypothetical protein
MVDFNLCDTLGLNKVMKKASVWFWAAFAYLVATVVYNLMVQWHYFFHYQFVDKVSVVSNLGLKIIAVALLLIRRKEAIYLLTAAFIIGLLGTLWGYYCYGGWATLPVQNKVGHIFGFGVSLAIILYLANASAKGVLHSRSVSEVQ